MAKADRASQFMPFAALKGFEEALESKELPMENKLIEADVICEHQFDATIIPIRFKIKNEDGSYQTYTIKGYRPVPKKGAYTTKDGVFVANQTEVFECKIEIFGMSKIVRLYYEPKKDGKWFLGTA